MVTIYVTIVFMGWNFNTMAPSHPISTCLSWWIPGEVLREVPLEALRASTGLPGVGGTWRKTRWGNIGILLSSTKNRQNAQQFQDSDDFPWFVDWGWSNFILSRLPDDIIFGSAKDLVPTAQMMYNSYEQICGCFHVFLSHAFLNGSGSENG